MLGGAAGAITGGIIGHQNDETPEGIIIGGAVGALAGGLLGHAKDEQVAREQYYQHQVWQQQQQLNRRRAAAVSMADVVQMSQSGLGDSLIVNHIQTNGVQRRLDTRDIIRLHQQGVSEGVINAMQRAPLQAVNYVPAPAPPRSHRRGAETVPRRSSLHSPSVSTRSSCLSPLDRTSAPSPTLICTRVVLKIDGLGRCN